MTGEEHETTDFENPKAKLFEFGKKTDESGKETRSWVAKGIGSFKINKVNQGMTQIRQTST